MTRLCIQRALFPQLAKQNQVLAPGQELVPGQGQGLELAPGQELEQERVPEQGQAPEQERVLAPEQERVPALELGQERVHRKIQVMDCQLARQIQFNYNYPAEVLKPIKAMYQYLRHKGL